MTCDPIPPFRPHRFLRSGHLQTLAGAWWRVPGNADCETSSIAWVDLGDGDRLALHDDVPAGWSDRDPTVLLVHGLAGSHASGYMVRIAGKLRQRGVRTFRLDLRGCGAGRGQARLPYHAGRSTDIAAAAAAIQTRLPASPLSVVGFSLAGNMLLKWLAELGSVPPAGLRAAVVINPPVDLAVCSQRIARSARGLYDRHFARLLYRQVHGSLQWNDDSPLARSNVRPRSLAQFDELFTAPLSGFRNAAHYYESSSAGPMIGEIRVPTTILTAADDPLIPSQTLTSLKLPPPVRLHVASGGGHLGYIGGAHSADPDRHWMDWRVVHWLTASH